VGKTENKVSSLSIRNQNNRQCVWRKEAKKEEKFYWEGEKKKGLFLSQRVIT